MDSDPPSSKKKHKHNKKNSCDSPLSNNNGANEASVQLTDQDDIPLEEDPIVATIQAKAPDHRSSPVGTPAPPDMEKANQQSLSVGIPTTKQSQEDKASPALTPKETATDEPPKGIVLTPPSAPIDLKAIKVTRMEALYELIDYKKKTIMAEYHRHHCCPDENAFTTSEPTFSSLDDLRSQIQELQECLEHFKDAKQKLPPKAVTLAGTPTSSLAPLSPGSHFKQVSESKTGKLWLT